MKPACETALTLRRAANVMTQMAAMRRPEPWDRPVADLLYAEAERAQATFDVILSLNEAPDLPPGIMPTSPADINQTVAGHRAEAMRIAQAILGIADAAQTVEIKEGLL